MMKTTCNLPVAPRNLRLFKWSSPLILALALAGILPAAHAEDTDEPVPTLTVLDRPERIKIDVTRERQSTDQGYHSKMERISFTIKLTNQDAVKEHKDLKAIFIVIAQNLAEKKRFVALRREDFAVNLGKGTADRELEHKTKECSTDFMDGRSYEYGEAYDGWALALVDSDDKIVACKASKESYQKNIGKIDNIKELSWFDLSLNPAEAAHQSSNKEPVATP